MKICPRTTPSRIRQKRRAVALALGLGFLSLASLPGCKPELEAHKESWARQAALPEGLLAAVLADFVTMGDGKLPYGLKVFGTDPLPALLDGLNRSSRLFVSPSDAAKEAMLVHVGHVAASTEPHGYLINIGFEPSSMDFTYFAENKEGSWKVTRKSASIS